MAITTGMVVRQTKQQIASSVRLISDTEQQIQQSERHHHDSSMPFLTIIPYLSYVTGSEREKILTTSMGGGAVFCLQGTINNLGQGIALQPTVRFWFPDMDDYVTTAMKIPPVGTGGYFGAEREARSSTKFMVALTGSFNETTFRASTDSTWKIILEYDDVFGNSFHTIHYKHPDHPWAEFGKGRFIPVSDERAQWYLQSTRLHPEG